MENMGERIYALRKEARMGQQALADAVSKRTGEGLSRQAVGAWETGDSKTLKPENLIAVADVFLVSVRWLVNGSGPKLAADAKALSDEEARLVLMWRELSIKDRADSINYVAGRWAEIKLKANPEEE